ncbi:endothelin-converting enzyme 1 [Dermacentor silvarum]|uniref:endothelin-converting enzyme 1 n=1 Tax=Dermacentor silvarum TaxID=543639 RepID=UPI002101B5DE|nr:endothelin-converting enzyme 1 [Dermacentor silvarum]
MISTHLKNGQQEDIFKESGRIAVTKPESDASRVEVYERNSDVALEAIGIPMKETAKCRLRSFSTSGRRSSRPMTSSGAMTTTTRSVASTSRSTNASRRSSVDLDGERTEIDAEGITAGEEQAGKYSTPEDRSLPTTLGQSEWGTKQQGAVDIAVGTLLLVLVLVLLVGILYTLFTGKKDSLVASCTDECLNAERYLERLINVKYNACGAFYERVCSSWSYTADSNFINDMVKEVWQRLNKSFLEDSASTVSSAQVRSARTIYRSCYAYARLETHLDSVLKDADKIMKFSSLHKVENWNELLQSLIRFSLEADMRTVFYVDLIGDKIRPVLHIAPGQSISRKLLNTVGMKAVHDFVREVLGAATQSILAIDQSVTNAFDTYDGFTEEQGSLERLLSDAIKGLSAIDWIVAVNKVVPKVSHVRVIDTIVANGMDGVRAALRVLTDAGLNKATEYLVANMAASIAVFDLVMPNFTTSPESTAAFCISVTGNIMHHSWIYVAAEILAIPNIHEELREMLAMVKEALLKSEVLSWTSDGVYTKAAKEVQNVSLLLARSRSRQRSVSADRVEASDVSGGDETASSLLAALFGALKAERSYVIMHPPSRDEMSLLKHEINNIVSYVASSNAIAVPALYQTPHLLYSKSVPAYFNYGTVGAVLAYETMIAFDLAASYTTLDGRRKYWWSDIGPERYNDTIGCLHQIHQDLGFSSGAAAYQPT